MKKRALVVLTIFAATMRAGFRVVDIDPDLSTWILGYGALVILWSISENAHRLGHIWLLVALHVAAVREIDRARKKAAPPRPSPRIHASA